MVDETYELRYGESRTQEEVVRQKIVDGRLDALVDKRIWNIHHKPNMDRVVRQFSAKAYQWTDFDDNNLYEPIRSMCRFIHSEFDRPLIECKRCGLFYNEDMYHYFDFYSRQAVSPGRAYWACCDCLGNPRI